MSSGSFSRLSLRASRFSSSAASSRSRPKILLSALLFFATALTQLWINQPTTFLRSSRLLLVFGVIFVQLAATKFVLLLCNSGTYAFLRPETVGLIAPYAFAPLVLSVLLGTQPRSLRVGLRQSLEQHSFRESGRAFARLRTDQRLYRVYLTLQVRQRSRLIRAGFGVGVAIWLLSLTFGIIGPIRFLFTGRNRLENDRHSKRPGHWQRHPDGNDCRRHPSDPGTSRFRSRPTFPGSKRPTSIIRYCAA